MRSRQKQLRPPPLLVLTLLTNQDIISGHTCSVDATTTLAQVTRNYTSTGCKASEDDA